MKLKAMINGTMYSHEKQEGDLSCEKCVAIRSGGLCGALQAQLPYGCLSSSVWVEVYSNTKKPRKKLGESHGQKTTDKASNTATKA